MERPSRNQGAALKLSVLGDTQAVPAAMYASSNTGQAVGVQSPSLRPGELAEAGFTGLESECRLQDSVLEGTELFVVISESAALKELLYEFRQVIAGKSVLLAPGGFAGALRVAKWFEEWDLRTPRVAEVTGFIAAGQRESRPQGLSFSLGPIKRALPFASFTNDLTTEMLADYVPFFPNLVASDLITTSLSNTNHMIHPGVVLLNAVRIENGEPFRFYREGLSPATADFLHAIDSERMEIVEALGAEPLSLLDWMLRFYGDQGMQGSNIVECLQSFPSFENTPSPPSLNYRYIADDVWYGLAQYLQLATQLGTTKENLQAIVSATARLCGTAARTADEESGRLFQNFLMNRTGAKS